MSETLKVQVTDVSPVKKRVEIEVPAEEVDREIEGLVRQYARQTRIPGFRRGHAPPSIIRQRFGADLRQEAKERLVTRFHDQAMKERHIHPLHDPVVEELSMEKGEPLKFRTLFEVRPEIELGSYRGLVSMPPRSEITDEDVEKALQSMRESAGRLVPVDPRPVEDGDQAVVDVEGRFAEGEGEDFRHESVVIPVGADGTMTEFSEALRGAAPGDVRTCRVTYPKEDGAGRLAGKQVDYTLTLREIKRREVPELDDEFAADMGEPEGLTRLRERVREDLGAARQHASERQARESALEKLIESHEFEVPEVMVEEQLGRQVEEHLHALAARGVDLRTAKIDYAGMREKELPLARRRVKGMLLLDEIVRKEGLEVTPSDVDARIGREASGMGLAPETLRARLEKGGGVQALKNQILRERALDIVLDRITITT